MAVKVLLANMMELIETVRVEWERELTVMATVNSPYLVKIDLDPKL